MAISGYAGYLAQRADPWERLAMTKARPVAGDPRLGGEFLAAIAPHVYRELTCEDVAALRHIKGRMERERARPSDAAQIDIKLAPGGITDVEYVVQFLQLRHGRTAPEVRQPSTVEALAALERLGLLDESDAATLRGGYLFLREVELAVQIAREQSDEVVSLEAGDMAMLAARLAGSDEDALPPHDLRARIRATMADIRAAFERLFL
jgi:glutamate-ammonia-ligase adenylyltransferase